MAYFPLPPANTIKKSKKVKLLATNSLSDFEVELNQAIQDGWQFKGQPQLIARDLETMRVVPSDAKYIVSLLIYKYE